MLESIKQRLGRDDEQGFTLIELMVVVLIIAILLAIAIPTFLGARNSANARAAQSDLRNAATAEQTFWTNNQAWGTYGDMQQVENSLQWVSTSTVSKGNNVLVTADSANNGVELTAMGADNNCYTEEIIDQPLTGQVAAGTYYYQAPTTTGSCSAAPAVTAPGTGSAAAHPTAWESTW
jgi:type IV pilus assembly protein PilA